MTLPPPVITDTLARVERGTYTADWYARCACCCDSSSHILQLDAIEASHTFACRCPLATKRLTRWRRRAKGLVA